VSKHEQKQWLADINEAQRNIVFPDTLRNEAKFWQNLGNRPFTTVQKVGLGLLALFVIGQFLFWAAVFRLDDTWKKDLSAITILMFIVFGPIFFAVAWATKRTLQSAHGSRKRWRR
jgi:hypothetical protein